MTLEINKIYNGDCLVLMKEMDDDVVDLTVTSPPYDDLRDYNEYSFNFEEIAKELYRITKNGGVVVWIVNDETKNGSESLTSFRQAIYFVEKCGFNLHDTMIWQKPGFSAVGSLKVRYAPVFEYMFVFSKGKLKTFNPIKDRINKIKGTISGTIMLKDGTRKRMSNEGKKRHEFGQRFNIWKMTPVNSNNLHPAMFPEQLAKDHILSWSNEGDLVLDPMCGSGTTCKMAKYNGRNYIGMDCSEEYCKIARTRLSQEVL